MDNGRIMKGVLVAISNIAALLFENRLDEEMHCVSIQYSSVYTAVLKH